MSYYYRTDTRINRVDSILGGERRARLRVGPRVGAGPTERRVRRGVRRALSGRERDVRRDSRQRLAMRRMRARDHRRGRGPGGSATGAVGRRVDG